ncbi:MAG: DUF4190 domain-containing protein [Kiritimatiellaeota bacterium]|nr:DUF4190 domain-containing protein [Kiritimatiellota bacterium]
MAIASMALSIVGPLTILGGGGFLVLLAIILGHIARFQINRSAGMVTGRGIAMAGLVLGYLTLVTTVLCLPFFLKP